MLHLAARTDATWGSWALANMDEMLLDHAHCEKKAASTAINLIFRYPDRSALLTPLSELAREELAHFELVLEHIRRRGAEFRRLEPSPYAGRLMSVARAEEPLRLVDTLLCCAMIEARSCERMQLIAEALETGPDASEDRRLLARLYRGLLASEARHHRSYLDLVRALEVVSDDELDERLAVVARHEAQVIAEAPTQPRLHNAHP